MTASETGRSWGPALWTTAIVLLALPPLAFRAYYLKEWGDEGFFVGAALRVLDGQVIYRDFQHNYPPGRAWTLAAALATFGRELEVVRAVWVGFHALAAGVAFLVVRRFVPTALAVLVAVWVVLTPVWLNKSVELLLAGWILLVLFRLFEGRTGPFLAGLGLAAAGWMRHDVAVFGTLLVPAALLLSAWVRREPGEAFGAVARVRLRGLLPFAGGVAVGLAPLALYLLSHGAFTTAVRELVFSGYVANKLLSRPFPTLGFEEGWDTTLRLKLLFYVPIAVYLLGAALSVKWLTEPARRSQGALLLLATALGSMLYLQVLPRTDFGHLNKAFLPAHVVAAVLVWTALRATVEAARASRPARAVGCAVLTLAVATLPAVHVYGQCVRMRGSLLAILDRRGRYVDVELPHGTLRFAEGNVAEYRQVFDEVTPWAGREDEWLLVYPAGAIFNLIFDLPNPLPYDVLRPGELAGMEYGPPEPNHPDVLQRIARRIEETRPRFLWDSAEGTNPEIQRMMAQYALHEGYRVVSGKHFRLFVRDD